ncbi:hypothetical protein RCL1_000110 [Eukaryota sp. TZLM3-RCL]
MLMSLSILTLLLAICFCFEVRSLPGLENFAIPLDLNNDNLDIDVDYSVSGVHLRVSGRYVSNIVRASPTTSLESLSSTVKEGTIVSLGGEVYRAKDCVDRCTFERSSPLAAYTSLSFTYETTRTRTFEFSWNFDPVERGAKEVLKINDQISFPDTYFYAGSALSIDFSFNIVQGIKKCEARLVSEVDLSLSVLLTNPNFSFDQRIASISLGTYTIPLGVPIPISPRLAIDFVGSVNAPGNYGATFKAKNELIEQTAGYLKGLYFTNDFGSWQTQFNQDVTTADISVMFGIRATIDVRVASAVSVNVSITPTIDGVVSFGRCPGTAFLDLDFLLHRSYGLSDIGFTVFRKFFGFKTDRVITVESPTRHKIISRCLNSQSLEVVAQSIQRENTPAYWVRVEVFDGTLSNVFMRVDGRRTSNCVVSGSRCSFSDSFHVREGELFKFTLLRSGIIWDTTLHNGNVAIMGSSPVTIWSTSGGHRIVITPVVAAEIEMNRLISINWTEVTSNEVFFELHKTTKESSEYTNKALWRNSIASTVQQYAATNVAATGSHRELLNFGSNGINTPLSRHHHLLVQCISQPSNKLILKMPDANREWTIPQEGASKWEWDFFLPASAPRTQLLTLDVFGYLWNTRIITMSHTVTIPGLAWSWGSPCYLDSDTFFPSIYMRVGRPSFTATYPFLFLYVDKTLCTECCNDYQDDSFYHFEPPGITLYNSFYQVSGRWSSLLQDTHISEHAIFFDEVSLLQSRAVQRSCLFKYFYYEVSELYDLARDEQYVVLIESPAYTVTRLACPDNMKWTSLKLNGYFWDLDEMLPTPDKESTIQFNNTGDFPVEFAVIYSCETTKCTGSVPVPRYSRRMVTGIPFYSSSKGNTEFQSTTECLRGEISYDIDSNVTVRIDVPHAGELYPITDIGSFTINHRFSEFIMRSSYDGEAFHWGTFTLNCINGPSSTVSVPPRAQTSIEYHPPVTSTSMTTSPFKGYIKLRHDDDSATIVGSTYSGKDTLLFVDGAFQEDVIHVASFSSETSFVAALEFVAYEKSEILCSIVNETVLECFIEGYDQFQTQFADVDFSKDFISLYTKNGDLQVVDLIDIEVVAPRHALLFYSGTVEAGSLKITGDFLTLSADTHTSDIIIEDDDGDDGGRDGGKLDDTLLLVAAVAVALVVTFGAALLMTCRKSKDAVESIELPQVSVAPETMAPHVVFVQPQVFVPAAVNGQILPGQLVE